MKKIHQFEAGRRMFDNLALCGAKNVEGQWRPEGVTCRRCKQAAKTTTKPVADLCCGRGH